ncbi:MAG TPA: TadE/TadG family type IV pilus assembly protein [Allosphingosinicella sp.]|nr:TadE/TadG family type IV pilus assembly protein [Allosphingosinicella sp.]
MMLRLGRLRTLGGEERGVSTIELGLIAPVLALFVAGIVDLSQGLAQRFTMQQAVNRSLELLVVRPPEGGADDDDVNYDYLKTEAAAAAGVPVEQVSVERWLQCNEERMDDYNDSCDTGEDSARYLELRIQKAFRGSFFVGQITITAEGAMRIQ